MEKKKLSELNLKKCIYMSVGPHAKEGTTENETFEKIISRKAEELDCEWSLWVDSRPTITKINKVFDKNDEVYALMSNNGKPVKSEGKLAKYYIEIDNIKGEAKPIPKKIHAIYSGNNKCSYALCVEAYYEVDEQDNVFNKGAYDRIQKDGKNYYFNGFELLEKKAENVNNASKIICYVAKLKYPFCVKVANEKKYLER